MTVIKATCPHCGDVDLAPRELRLEVTETLALNCHAFVFECRECQFEVHGAITQEMAGELQAAGVVTVRHHLPAEAREPHAGTPIAEDDVIAFGQWLERTADPIALLMPA